MSDNATHAGAGPLPRYQAALDAGRFSRDPAQQQAAELLQACYVGVVAPRSRRGWRFWRRPPPPAGAYLWGGVGSGKTWLMDLFYDSLPRRRRRRVHFHRFMREVHADLRRRGEGRDPLPKIARELAADARVLCFDELFVSDVGDAMLLGSLLRSLVADGVTLVATSNVHPDDLYRGGLQRARFLPAIDCLKHHCHVLEVAAQRDYRLRELERAGLYCTPLDDAAGRALESIFGRLAPGSEHTRTVLRVNGRGIQARRLADGIAWFGFDALCREARSAEDYIELARDFNTVLIEGIPVLDDDDAAAVRRLIALVDEFYDRGVKLAVSAAATPPALYRGEMLAFEFRRTVSRLEEMQSHAYLARPHRP